MEGVLRMRFNLTDYAVNWETDTSEGMGDTAYYTSLYCGGWTYSTRQWIGMKLRELIDKILFKLFDL